MMAYADGSDPKCNVQCVPGETQNFHCFLESVRNVQSHQVQIGPGDLQLIVVHQVQLRLCYAVQNFGWRKGRTVPSLRL